MYKSDEIKLLKINGVYPDDSSIISGKYPYITTGNIYIRKEDENNKNIKKWIDFVKSAEGKKIIEDLGYIINTNS